MAELRKFKFFDLNLNVDNGALAAALKDTHLTVATSGHTCFIFGDGEGNIVILNKLFEPTIFKAYNISITHAEYIKHSPYLVTVGDDEPGINPVLKVWNLEVTDKGGNPRCVRVTRLIPNQKAVKATALGVHESATFMAVGFQNGSILLFRGDVARDRSSKPRVLKDSGSNPITGLAFRVSALTSYLFVTSESSVVSYDITTKDREAKWVLDNEGCSQHCCAMADLPHEAHFVVAREGAVFCYTADGKGPCYAMDGRKVYIQWSKTFLAVVAKEDKTSVNPMRPGINSEVPADNYTVILLDIHNNMIVSSSTLPAVAAILVECGSFYIITKDQKIHHLAEKDLQSKMSLLFKKNFYDIAIRLAKSQHYDEDGLVDIFRQYGDHLHNKGDRAGAIEQYIKTIGKLEPSYIIRKFMDSAHMEQLMEYLQALHRKGVATGDHTTLLLNCYIKLGKATDLKEFIMTKGRKVDFDIDIALKVVRGVSADDALSLAKAHGRHQWVLRILLEDMKRYQDAISYISNLDFYDAEKCILDFGGVLIEHAPAETTKFLKELCIKYHSEAKPTEKQLFELDGLKQASARPQDFLHLFLLKSEYLVEFLEHLVSSRTGWDTQIYNALVEHYLVLWSKSKDRSHSTVEQNIMKLLNNPDAPYDRQHIFILCEMYDFSPGRILLYEENKMYYQVVQAHVEQKNYKAVLASCRRFGNQDPNIWIHALWAVAQQPDTPQHVLSEILSIIDKERLQPPLMTLEALGEGTTLGQARRYFAAIIQAEDEIMTREAQLIENYSSETGRVRAQTRELENSTIIFQCSRCSVCQRQLELPSVHFLCQHSYHQQCLQSYSENESECIVCRKNNKVFLDMIKSQENSHELHEAFHDQLNKSNDCFEVVADYLGRGVFNKVPVPTPDTSLPPVRAVSTAVEKTVTTIPTTSAPTISVTAPAAVAAKKSEPTQAPQNILRRSPVAEDRIAYSMTDSQADFIPKRSPEPSTSLVTQLNPFDGDDDDFNDAKNPFADDADDASYNDELNPFA